MRPGPLRIGGLPIEPVRPQLCRPDRDRSDDAQRSPGIDGLTPSQQEHRSNAHARNAASASLGVREHSGAGPGRGLGEEGSDPQAVESMTTPETHNEAYSSPLRWMKLDQYCSLSGDTRGAVHARRRKGQWFDGKHCRVGPDGNLWINPEEVNKWVESSQR